MNTIIHKILQQWNIREDVLQIYGSTWSIGDNYILKAYDNISNLNQNIIMMKTLNESGIPVAMSIPTTDGRDYLEVDGKYYLLMNKLSGTHITDIYQADYFNIAYETGKIVASLHNAFKNCEQKITFNDNSLLDEVKGWIYNALNTNHFQYVTESDFLNTLNELESCYDRLPRQLIHRDIHYGNILFNNDTISGYIDFDLTQKNARIFDICYFLIGLLNERVKNKDDVKKWYQVVSRFVKGYDEINQLTKLEKDSICCIMKNIELLFVAYFICIENENSATSSSDLFYFVKNNEDTIVKAIYNI